MPPSPRSQAELARGTFRSARSRIDLVMESGQAPWGCSASTQPRAEGGVCATRPDDPKGLDEVTLRRLLPEFHPRLSSSWDLTGHRRWRWKRRSRLAGRRSSAGTRRKGSAAWLDPVSQGRRIPCVRGPTPWEKDGTSHRAANGAFVEFGSVLTGIDQISQTKESSARWRRRPSCQWV